MFQHMIGNHDWYYRLPGEAFDEIRKMVTEAMGLCNDPGPFPYELEEHRVDVRSVSARKPLFMDESAHNWELVRLGKLRWRIEQDYRELKGALGLDHLEGRGWAGWHHHLTLVAAAHGFLTLERLRRPKQMASA